MSHKSVTILQNVALRTVVTSARINVWTTFIFWHDKLMSTNYCKESSYSFIFERFGLGHYREVEAAVNTRLAWLRFELSGKLRINGV